MPKLSPAQKEQIALWVNEGVSLSAVQKRINTELGVSLTYMEVRLVVDDLDLTLREKDEPQPAETPPAAEENATPPAQDPVGDGSVRVSVDLVQRPGALVGGSVTFSDGKTGQWQMDMNGQLGFVPPFPGYKPAQADVQRFQVVLDEELRKLGY